MFGPFKKTPELTLVDLCHKLDKNGNDWAVELYINDALEFFAPAVALSYPIIRVLKRIYEVAPSSGGRGKNIAFVVGKEGATRVVYVQSSQYLRHGDVNWDTLTAEICKIAKELGQADEVAEVPPPKGNIKKIRLGWN